MEPKPLNPVTPVLLDVTVTSKRLKVMKSYKTVNKAVTGIQMQAWQGNKSLTKHAEGCSSAAHKKSAATNVKLIGNVANTKIQDVPDPFTHIVKYP